MNHIRKMSSRLTISAIAMALLLPVNATSAGATEADVMILNTGGVMRFGAGGTCSEDGSGTLDTGGFPGSRFLYVTIVTHATYGTGTLHMCGEITANSAGHGPGCSGPLSALRFAGRGAGVAEFLDGSQMELALAWDELHGLIMANTLLEGRYDEPAGTGHIRGHMNFGMKCSYSNQVPWEWDVYGELVLSPGI